MKNRLFCALLVAVAVATPAMAVDWRFVTTSVSNSHYMIDIDSIRKISGYSDPGVTAWFKIDHSNDKTTAARTSKNLYHAKCASSELALKQWIEYKADGSVLNSSSGDRYLRHSVVAPETVGYSILEAMCNPYTKYRSE